MKFFPKHISRIILFIVALQTMNLGLFAQDFQPLDNASTNVEINIINTVDEYIAEVVFHHKDAVPENNKHPQKDLQAHKHLQCKLINVSRPQILFTVKYNYSVKPASLAAGYNYLFCSNIYPPPPKR